MVLFPLTVRPISRLYSSRTDSKCGDEVKMLMMTVNPIMKVKLNLIVKDVFKERFAVRSEEKEKEFKFAIIDTKTLIIMIKDLTFIFVTDLFSMDPK
ncbi:MAG: hypothetical protein EZS28_054384 [Streblomastix strix]|uniref:Uncharacterized protein n=1 Tax=Streblomastix strix TaxID=222440 RepID=A0A5J4QPH5_9EUKA|nr:MAG: hypothetical protein EZS28_054384 [Streblomastix strix]